MTNLDYLYNPDAAQKFFGKNYLVDKKLHFQIIERGTILPHKHLYINGNWTWGFGGIVDRHNEFVKSSFVRYGAGAVYTPTEDVQRNPTTVVYLELFVSNWGHNITDNFRRLWFLKSEVFEQYFKNCPIVYIPWGGYMELISTKTFGAYLRFWRSTLTGLYRLITRRSLKISFCPTNLILCNQKPFLLPSIKKLLTA